MTERVAVFPPAESSLGWGSWAREFAAAVAVTIRPQKLPPQDLPRGDGHPVLLIPGFTSGDWSLIRLAAFLSRQGYQPHTTGIWFNPGPSRALVRRLDEVLLKLAADQKMTLIGVSLGGVLARDLARRHPKAVRAVITLCSPVQFPVTTPLEPFARLLAPLHAPEWVSRRHEIAEPLDVPVFAVHVTHDGVVDWRQCVVADSPGARNICVEGRHMTIASNPAALEVIARALPTTC